MTEVTNRMRAEWAREPLDKFASDTFAGRTFSDAVTQAGLGDLAIEDTDASAMVSDLICDLLHLAQQSGLDPDEVLNAATSSFDAERKLATDEVDYGQ